MGQPVYQTLTLTNHGVTSVTFDGTVQGTEGYALQPRKGAIPPGESQMIAVRFLGAEARAYGGRVRLTFNNVPSSAHELPLKAAAFLPAVALEGGATTFLRSTCVGTASETELGLRNASRAPVAFAIQVPEALRDVISFEPTTGVLQGNQRLALRCVFSPQKVRRYAIAVPCRVVGHVAGATPSGASELSAEVSVFNVVGEGTEGGILLGQSAIDLGVVQVGSVSSTSLSLLNKSGGALQFALECVALDADGHVTGPAADVDIRPATGALSAHVERTVSIRYSPGHRAPQVRYVVRCFTGSGGGGAVLSKEPSATCELQARAEHPLLTIEDIAAPGAPGQKLHLWENAGITSINDELYRALLPDELALSSAFDEGTDSGASVIHMLEGRGIPVVLPAGPLGSAPCPLTLRLRNPGPLDAQWSFSFPHEEDVESELWVQPVWPPSATEEVQSRFVIHPKAGKLRPGETTEIHVLYNRSLLGAHCLPVLLHVTQGRSMRLELCGTTTDPASPRLALPDGLEEYVHRLEEVAIGSTNAPLQPYLLTNATPNDLLCSVDLDHVHALNAAEYDFPVLALASPDAFVIPANGSYVLYWRFTPLEAGRRYAARVPITVAPNDPDDRRASSELPSRTYVLQLTGRGVLPTGEDGEDGAPPEEGDYRRTLRQVPHPSRIVPAGALATLSHSLLDLGEIPLHRPSAGLVAVTAAPGAPRPVEVHWDAHRSFGLADVPLAFTPPRAVLQPGETRLFRCTLGPHNTAAYLQQPCTLHATLQAAAPPSPAGPRSPEIRRREPSVLSDATAASARRSVRPARLDASEEDDEAVSRPATPPLPTASVQLEVRAFLHGGAPDTHPHLGELHREALRQWGAGALRPEQAGAAVAAELTMLFEEVAADLACDPAVYEAAAQQERIELEGRGARAPTLHELGADEDASASAAAAAVQVEVEAFVEGALEGAVLALLQEAAAVGLAALGGPGAEGASGGRGGVAMTSGLGLPGVAGLGGTSAVHLGGGRAIVNFAA